MSWSRSLPLLLVAAVGCRNEGGAVLVRDTAEYDSLLRDVQEATVEPFRAHRDDFPLSDAEKQALYDADRKITGLIEFAPTKYSLHVLRGMTRDALGKGAQAIEAFEQALTLAPADPVGSDRLVLSQVFTHMASISFDEGDFGLSEQYAQEAVKLAPNDPDALTNLASAQVELEQTEKAKENLKRALSVSSDFPRARALLKLIEQG